MGKYEESGGETEVLENGYLRQLGSPLEKWKTDCPKKDFETDLHKEEWS